jgi:hypothetical protein
MGKYLVLWEVDQTKIPIDPKERGEGWSLLMALVRQDIEKGITKDWGASGRYECFRTIRALLYI